MDDIIKKFKGHKRTDLLMVFPDGDTCDEVKEKPKWVKNVMFVYYTNRNSEMPFGKTLFIDPADVRR